MTHKVCDDEFQLNNQNVKRLFLYFHFLFVTKFVFFLIKKIDDHHLITLHQKIEKKNFQATFLCIVKVMLM